MNKLFGEFDPVDKVSWMKQIEKDLKGKPLDLLMARPEADIEISAVHHQEDFKSEDHSNLKSGNIWKIRKAYSEVSSNEEILDDLNNGVEAISIRWTNKENYAKQMKGVLPEHIHVDIRPDHLKDIDSLSTTDKIVIGYDPIALNLKAGSFVHNLSDWSDLMNKRPNQAKVWVNGHIYGDSGATSIQELAMSLAHLNEYLHILKENESDIKSQCDKIYLSLSVSPDYFVNVAKFSLSKNLIRQVVAHYEKDFRPEIIIHAVTGMRTDTQNDRYNNLLRKTTEAMSAVIGGCDLLSVRPHFASEPAEQQLHDRMARNVQLILKEEAYLDKVFNPGAGSYFISALKDQISEKTWQLFVDFEDQGGLMQCARENHIQEYIDRNREKLTTELNQEKRTLLGVNKFRHPQESFIQTERTENSGASDFIPVSPFRLEEVYEPKSVSHE